MPKRLRPRKWPHFMEKNHKPKEQIYVSTKILGQLYDKVESIDFVPQYEAPFDKRILQAYQNEYTVMETVRQLKAKYDTAVRRLMAQHEIKTEFEIWSTFVLSKPRVGSDYKVQEEMAIVSEALKDRFRRVCVVAAKGDEPNLLRPFVAAMYRVTYEEMQHALRECSEMITIGSKQVPKRKMEPKYMPLISFPWLFHDILGGIATGEERGGLEHFGLFFASTTKKSRKVNSGREESDPDDWIETTHGIIHRGELLELFAPDDVDSEGEPIGQPSRGGNMRTPTTDESGDDGNLLTEEDSLGDILHNTAMLHVPAGATSLTATPSEGATLDTAAISEASPPLAKSPLFSPSIAELAFLDTSGDFLDSKLQHQDPDPFFSPSTAELAFLVNSGDLIGSELQHQDADPLFSPSTAELAFLKTPSDLLAPELQHLDADTDTKPGKLNGTGSISSDGDSSLGDLLAASTSAEEPLEEQVLGDYGEFEEVVLVEEEESPLERLARLTGS